MRISNFCNWIFTTKSLTSKVAGNVFPRVADPDLDPECFPWVRMQIWYYHSGSGSDPEEEEGRKFNIFTLKLLIKVLILENLNKSFQLCKKYLKR